MSHPFIVALLGLFVLSQAPEQKKEVVSEFAATKNLIQPFENVYLFSMEAAEKELIGLMDSTVRFDFVATNESGLTMTPVDGALRAQLRLPEGTGLMVTSVTAGGPADQVGIESNDILLALGEHKLGKPENLDTALATISAKGKGTTMLTLIRGGKTLELKVRPHVKVILGSDEPEAPKYWIGVHVAELDPALRSHLKVEGNQGLIINVVTGDSPASKTGLAVHDILVSYNGKPLTDNASLVTQVQASGDKPADLVVLRGGKLQNLKITPDARKVDVTENKKRSALWVADKFSGYRAYPGMTPGDAVKYQTPMRTQGGVGSNMMGFGSGQPSGEMGMGMMGRPSTAPTAKPLTLTGGMMGMSGSSSRNAVSQPQLQELQAEIKELRKLIEEERKALKEVSSKKP